MSKRWSKLQQRLYNLMDPELNFQIHCALYEMNGSGPHGNKLPRYFITINKDIVFDYPRQFNTSEKYGYNSYPWDGAISSISDIIEEYIQTPKEKLLNGIEGDIYGLTELLLACDRRTSKKMLCYLGTTTQNKTVSRIVLKRLGAEVIH